MWGAHGKMEGNRESSDSPPTHGCTEFKNQNHHVKYPNNNFKRLNEGHRTESVHCKLKAPMPWTVSRESPHWDGTNFEGIAKLCHV